MENAFIEKLKNICHVKNSGAEEGDAEETERSESVLCAVHMILEGIKADIEKRAEDGDFSITNGKRIIKGSYAFTNGNFMRQGASYVQLEKLGLPLQRLLDYSVIKCPVHTFFHLTLRRPFYRVSKTELGVRFFDQLIRAANEAGIRVEYFKQIRPVEYRGRTLSPAFKNDCLFPVGKPETLLPMRVNGDEFYLLDTDLFHRTLEEHGNDLFEDGLLYSIVF